MTFPLEPLNGFVFVEQDLPDEKTPGGILVAPSGAKRPFRGRVVAAGPGHRMPSGFVEPMPVVAGDMVLFGWQNAGEEVEVDGVKYRVLHQHALLAILVGREGGGKDDKKGRPKGRQPVRRRDSGA
jgi:chaperonin GroES